PDANGNPLNNARVTLRMHKSVPDDIAQFVQANPAAKLQEIPLADLSAILISIYFDDAGQEQQRTFTADIQDLGAGGFVLVFDSIVGVSVIGLYEDLTLFGKAVINLSGSYQAWAEPRIFIFHRLDLVRNPAFLRVSPSVTASGSPGSFTQLESFVRIGP